MSKILFATDGSKSAAAARRFISALPLPEGTAVRIVSVAVDCWTPLGGSEPAPLLDLPGMEAAERKRAQDTVEDASEEILRTGIEVSTVVPSGQAAYEIIKAADEFQADLIVVGSKGESGLEGFLLGSVARNVANHAHCSVLIAREVRHALGTVILALDGSSQAAQAVRFTVSLPLPPNSKVVALSVIPTPGMLSFEPPEDLLSQARAVAGQWVNSACGGLAAAGKLASSEVRLGDAATEILSAGEEHAADLIVAGARGHSLVKGLLLGSVADRLLKRADRSLLIVR